MKKLVALVLVIFLSLSLPTTAVMESKGGVVPLSERQAIYLLMLESMWQSDEWQRVEVPAGVYEIGVEIPEGEWTISNDDMFIVRIGPHLNETKTEIDYQGMKFGNLIDMDDYKNGLTANLIKGDYIYLSDAVVFTTPIKGQGFVFK
jgi:hypothetical protein